MGRLGNFIVVMVSVKGLGCKRPIAAPRAPLRS